MSKVLVDTIDTRSGTSTMQIGSTNTTTINLGVSGDTVNIPSGVTIANSGTATGFSSSALSEVDLWRVTANFTGATFVTSNWERCDTNFEKIGTGMSESSGVFTFPSTGKWWIATFVMISKNGDSRYNDWQIQHSGNSGVSWDSTIYCSQLVQQTNSAGGMGSMSGNQLMDITDASTARLRATFGDGGNSTTLVGASATTNVSIAFMRIGDT